MLCTLKQIFQGICLGTARFVCGCMVSRRSSVAAMSPACASCWGRARAVGLREMRMPLHSRRAAGLRRHGRGRSCRRVPRGAADAIDGREWEEMSCGGVGGVTQTMCRHDDRDGQRAHAVAERGREDRGLCDGTVRRRGTAGFRRRKREKAWQASLVRPLYLGAGDRSRTYDLRITNALLYQLSYTGSREMKLYSEIRDLGNRFCEIFSACCGCFAKPSIRRTFRFHFTATRPVRATSRRRDCTDVSHPRPVLQCNYFASS